MRIDPPPPDAPIASEISPRTAVIGLALVFVFALGVPAFATAGGKCAPYRSCVPQDCKVAPDMPPDEVAKCCKPPTPQLCAQAALSDLKGDVFGSEAARKAVGSGWDVNKDTAGIAEKLFGEKDYNNKQNGALKACGIAAADFKDIPPLETDCKHLDQPFHVDVGAPAGDVRLPSGASPTDFENALKKGKRPDGCSSLSGVCAEQVTNGFLHEQDHYGRCPQAIEWENKAKNETDRAAARGQALFNLQDEADAYHHEARRYQHTIKEAKRSCDLAKKNAAPPPSSSPGSSTAPNGPPSNGAPSNGAPSNGSPPSSGSPPPTGEPAGWPIGDPPSSSGVGPGAPGPRRWGNPFLEKALADLGRFHKVGAW